MKKIILAASLLTLTACAVKLSVPTQADVDRVTAKYPDYTLTALEEGKANFENKCTMCHSLKSPTSETEAEWHKIVPQMVAKANKQTVNIDAKTKESILRYLVTMSTASKK